MALVGTRGIANAAVAELASATAIKPALMYRFIGISSTAHRQLTQVPELSFCSKSLLGHPTVQKRSRLLRGKSQLPFFPDLDWRCGNLC
jgi:hypothetical protein